MRKMILLTITIILIPFLVVSIFIKEKEIDFNLVSNETIRVMRNETGTIDIVPFEEYIVGVVAGEMPVTFHIEALKAQAVAARNYAYKKIESNKESEYDVIDTTSNHRAAGVKSAMPFLLLQSVAMTAIPLLLKCCFH